MTNTLFGMIHVSALHYLPYIMLNEFDLRRIIGYD